MSYSGDFDFFYGMESERHNFLIIPKLLLQDERFKHISAEAKLLYGLLLERNSLSQRNGWLDEKNRVYIIYTIKQMQEDLGCASQKVNHVLRELENIGLIYRKRNGRGIANFIYVMDYMAIYKKYGYADEQVSQDAIQEAESLVFPQNSENHYSRNVKITTLDFRKSLSNKTNNNKTDNNLYNAREGDNKKSGQNDSSLEKDKRKENKKTKKKTSFHNFDERKYGDLEQLLKSLHPP